MAREMEKLFKDLGGKIHYNKKVEEIVTKDKRVQGLMVDGDLVESDIVVSNADFPYTMAP